MSFHLISCHLTSSYLITSHLTSPHLISSSFHVIVISFDLQFISFKFNSTSVHLHVNSFTHRYMRTRRQIWIRTSLTLPQDAFPQQSHDRFYLMGSFQGVWICVGWRNHVWILLSWKYPMHEGSYVSVTKQRLEVSISTLRHPHWRLPQEQSG